MSKNPKPPKLTVVGPTNPADQTAPPANLGEAGATLWRSIMAEYQITDSGGLALLQQACNAIDRIEHYSAAIAENGLVIHTRHGPKANPLLKDELQARSFLVRTLQRLGVTNDPQKSVGRPPTVWQR